MLAFFVLRTVLSLNLLIICFLFCSSCFLTFFIYFFRLLYDLNLLSPVIVLLFFILDLACAVISASVILSGSTATSPPRANCMQNTVTRTFIITFFIFKTPLTRQRPTIVCFHLIYHSRKFFSSAAGYMI